MSKRLLFASSIAAAPSSASSDVELEPAGLQHLADHRAHRGGIVDDQHPLRQPGAHAIVDQRGKPPAARSAWPARRRPQARRSAPRGSSSPRRRPGSPAGGSARRAPRRAIAAGRAWACGNRTAPRRTRRCVEQLRSRLSASAAAATSTTSIGIEACDATRRISSRSGAASETISILRETKSSFIDPSCHAKGMHAGGRPADDDPERLSEARIPTDPPVRR